MEQNDPPSFEDFHLNYRVGKRMGGGKFGEVFKVEHKTTNELKAFKIVKCQSERDIRDVNQEIQIMKQLDHSHILKVHSFSIQL